MGGHKKSYCIKLLHLALALSLLHVDPDSFLLQQRLRNWDSQLEFSHGNGWELEMLRAVPMVPPEYPYANRKSMLPLIEDLVLYDRERETEQLRTDWNVTAYHLLSDGLGSGNGVLSNQNASTNTANVQDIQVPVANTAATLSSPIIDNENLTRVTRNDTGVPTLDLFLNSDMLQDQRSLWEQNLADLHDFGDLPASNVYTNLPLKDDPEASYNGNFLDINLEPFLLGFDGLHNLLDGAQAAGASNGSFPLPSDNPYIKLERIEDNENVTALNDTNDTRNLSTNSSKESETEESGIKQEQAAEEENAQAVLPEVDLSSFINVNSIKEESEIVEVLWKQDVDLGYSLTPRALNEAESKSASKHSEENEEYEKLKALNNPDKVEDDKNFDFTNGDLDNDWSGIPFTIDNETGEYIRLPLEEIFKDVLQLEGFDTNTTSADNSLTADLVGASTSQAAVTANNALEKEVKVQIQNESEEQEITLKELVENSSGIEDSSEDKDNNFGEKSSETEPKTSESGLEFDFDCDLQSPLFDLDDEAKEELAQFDMMIQSNFHHHSPHGHAGRSPAAMQNYAVGGGVNSAFHRQTSATGFHHGHHQGRLPLSRSVSMEQHLQDIASLFNPMPNMGMPDMPSYAAYAPHPYSYQSAGPQHAQYPPPPPPPHARHPSHATHHSMLHPNGLNDICAPPQPHYGHNLGSAVTSSMHLTNPIHEDNVGLSASGGVPNAYKMEHDMNYYSNTSSEMNHTADGFINSILNDEDLHLMDMNVNNDFCRMVDVNSTSNNSTIGHMNVASGGAVNTGMTADMLSGPHSQVTGSTTGIGTAGDRLDASSDSAVSSMGSERVPSLSDGEWGEGSDSAQDYHAGKYGGPYDYSYNNNTATAHNRHRDVNERQPPVAQKKHQMFGKRYLNEQNSTPSVVAQPPVAAQSLLHVAPAPVKYEYKPYDVGVVPPMSNANLPHAQAQAQAQAQNHTDLQHGYDLKYPSVGVAPYSLDFSLRSPRNPHDIVQHNHTYSLPQGSGSLPRPQQRDKKNGGGASAGKAAKLNGNSCAANNTHEDEHLTRDEKRARALNIPITVNDIINLPMDEFNERLSKYDLNENQLSLIRDIRRRGKNKVAAQNCRKRKLDQILSLEDEVKEVRRRKEHLQHQHDELYVERKRISNKFAALHRHIFQYLRDPEGNPCSATDYSLQLATDGSVYLLPRDSSNVSEAIAPITAAPGSVRAQQVAVQNHAHHQHLQQQQHQQQQATALNGVMHASQQQQQQQQQQPSHHQVPPKE